MVLDTPPSLGRTILFNTFTILSFVLIAAIISTAYFSKYVKRPNVWYGQMIQWIIYCISYMLLFGYQRNVEPPRALCLFQASLIYACPPACAVGSACFMVDLYMAILLLHKNPTQRVRRLNLFLILLPWVVLVCAALQVILFTAGGKNMDTVQRQHDALFCNVSDQEPTIVSVTLVLLAVTVWFYFEVRTGIIMYQNKLEFKRINYKTSHSLVSLYIRSAIFTIGTLVATGLSIYCMPQSTKDSTSWALLLPFMPIFVAIVFGSQKDIMRVWIFWRKRAPEEEECLTLSSFSSRLSLVLASDGFPGKSLQAI